MKEKNLLAELAAYLFSNSDKETGRTPSERELAEHFGVSRGQIREALAILEAMRIVERRAKSGIYVDTKQASVEALALFARAGLPLDPVQIYETVELRKIHEIKAAELACSRATEENFERLREILKASEERIAAGEGLAKEDREFHLEIVRATKNSVFHNICSVYYLMGELRLPIYFNDPERSVRSHAEHIQIYEALLRRDGNLAQALMSAHLQGAESYWKGLIGGQGGRASEPGARKGLTHEACPISCRRIRCIRAPRPCWSGPVRLVVASALDASDAAAEAKDADIVIVRAPLPPALFEGAAKLRAAIRHGAGLDMIPMEAATAAGVLVANVPAVNARSVAEHVMFAALALLRRFRLVDRDLRAKGWLAGREHANANQRARRQDHRHCRPRRRRPGGRPHRRARLRPQRRGDDAQHAAGARQGRFPVDRRAGRTERHHRSVLPADGGDARPDQPRAHRPHEAECAADQRLARAGGRR